MYYLVDPSVLKEKGVENFETMPDGRAIVDGSTLKAIGRCRVEVMPSAMAVRDEIEKMNYKLKKSEDKE